MAYRACPFCRKNVDYRATICPYCKKDIPRGSFFKTGFGCLLTLVFVFFGIIIVMIAAVSGGPSKAPLPGAVSAAKPSHPAPFNVGQKVRVWGKNEKGEMEVPAPNIWKQPGNMSARGQGLAGRIGSGSTVKIKAARYVAPRWYFLVKTKNGGRKGWISESLLKP